MGPVDQLVPPPGAVLVRTRATGPGWVTGLPVVPTGHLVTASVGDPRLREVPAADLLATGYRVVGVHAATEADRWSVDLLVRADLVAAHPRWWQHLVAVADRAFDLRHGPVQRVLGREIALHLAH